MPRKKRSTRDPHARFTDWLEGIGADDPPRDLAVHAAVCMDCQELIAAVDALTAIDTAMAGIPQARPLPAPGWLRRPAARLWRRAAWRRWWPLASAAGG